MFNPLALRVGWRFFKARASNRYISFISIASMVGIAMGVAVLIVVLSAMNGFERELRQNLLSMVAHGELTAVEGGIMHPQNIVDKANSIDAFRLATPEYNLNALIRTKDGFSGIEVKGVTPELENEVSNLASKMAADVWLQLRDSHLQEQAGIVLGQSIATKLALMPGQSLSLYLPANGSRGLNRKQFTYLGSFKSGGELDSNRAYAHRLDIAKLMATSWDTTSIKLTTNDLFQAPYLVREFAFSLSEYLYISDWSRTHGHLYNDIQLVRTIMYLVLFLVIAVACFNIVSTLVMAVQEKHREIAILQTMGMTSKSILQVFMVQGSINGVLGTIIGAFIGVICAVNLSSIIATIETWTDSKLLDSDVYFVDHLPSLMLWNDVVVIVVVALLMSFIATLYPAYKASKLPPARSLG
ncbi:lipoprotein-releasing ABC transporter permease subunit [Paraferrimonas sp. SM1919]|uniref:lipoprotein-releasing ABC transporter permease subunit n=1 Tax=Paraferrimonas sp. SM1919 TaxID=2662263 RepID=UPI0013D580D4|nr:lipoprotein-releasing ABC transporter permease subunit [Paraferrimonas sp. SM1919]